MGLNESDEEDECTQESSGDNSYDTHEGYVSSQKSDLTQVDEDFTFGDLPDYKRVVNVGQIQQLQDDLLEFIPKFSKENERINNIGEYVLSLTTGEISSTT